MELWFFPDAVNLFPSLLSCRLPARQPAGEAAGGGHGRGSGGRDHGQERHGARPVCLGLVQRLPELPAGLDGAGLRHPRTGGEMLCRSVRSKCTWCRRPAGGFCVSGLIRRRHDSRWVLFVKVTPECMAEWGSRQAHLNEMGNFLMESTDPQTSRSLAEELRRLNLLWAEFVKTNALVSGGTGKTWSTRRFVRDSFPVINLIVSLQT